MYARALPSSEHGPCTTRATKYDDRAKANNTVMTSSMYPRKKPVATARHTRSNHMSSPNTLYVMREKVLTAKMKKATMAATEMAPVTFNHGPSLNICVRLMRDMSMPPTKTKKNQNIGGYTLFFINA